jgi:ribosome recycling factor
MNKLREYETSMIKKCEVSLDQKSISEDDIQNLTNKYITQIDKIYSIKEKEILSV